MNNESINRRDFLKRIGAIEGGLLLLSSPWFSAFADVEHTTGNKARIGFIGPGSRGCFLLGFLAKIRKRISSQYATFTNLQSIMH